MHAIVEFRSYKKGEPQHGEQNPVVTIFTRSVQRFLLFEPTIVNKRGIDYEKKITGDNVSSVQNVISGLLINKGYALGLPNNLALKYGPILGGALGGGTSTAAFIMINKILGLFFLPQARIPLAILSLALLMLDFGKTAIFYHASLLGVVCSIWVCNRFSVSLMKRFCLLREGARKGSECIKNFNGFRKIKMINDLKKLSLFVTLRPCNGLTDGPQQIIKNLVDEGCFKNMAFFLPVI